MCPVVGLHSETDSDTLSEVKKCLSMLRSPDSHQPFCLWTETSHKTFLSFDFHSHPFSSKAFVLNSGSIITTLSQMVLTVR